MHGKQMQPRFRHAELLSPDEKLRLAIYDRADYRYQIVEERVRCYGPDADDWVYVPFPRGTEWEAPWQIEALPRDGLFGTVTDALGEARLLITNGS